MQPFRHIGKNFASEELSAVYAIKKDKRAMELSVVSVRTALIAEAPGTQGYVDRLCQHFTENVSTAEIDIDCLTGNRWPDSPHQASKWGGSHMKRAMDFLISLLMVAVLSPLMLLVYAGVRCSSKGPGIYRQARIGAHGVQFIILKFRTMHDWPTFGGCSRARKDDIRITALGAFLRRSKLDELPQLFNVLRGDMSLVGPRPKMVGHESWPTSLRPGITGLATLAFTDEEQLVAGLSDQELLMVHDLYFSPVKRCLDDEYLCTSSLCLDVQIAAKTVCALGRVHMQ